ncbi:MAG: histidine--tRNA ligase, partial [Gammaproteobacteria bacterium]
FQRSIGEATDIVEKEMYSFDDRNGDSLSLRPENTAGVVRAGLQNGLFNGQHQRLWYCGPMFRHERPQKGRYRQFYQLGAEAFGMADADIEAELIFLAARFWKVLGLDNISLQINTLGNSECRSRYREILVSYFRDHSAALDDDSLRRLETNPLRILDSKNPDIQTLIEDAPTLTQHLDPQSEEHFSSLMDILDYAQVSYEVNPRLVRGLDYYSHSVFEWVTDTLGAQGTVCAGGRYDGLVEQLGGRADYAAGFAIGCERLIAMIIDQNQAQKQQNCDVYFLVQGEGSVRVAHKVAEGLRDKLPQLSMVVHADGGSFKSQMRKAHKSGAKLALILGESEIESGNVSIKYLREDVAQIEIAQTDLPGKLAQLI